MTTVAEIKKFLKKHNYTVKILSAHDGCQVLFPDRKSSPKLDTNIIDFSYKEGQLYCNGNSITIPEYSFRTLTSCFILKWCLQIGYQAKYLILVDKEGKELTEGSDILDVLPAPTNKDLRLKERNLITIFCEAWPDGFAEDYDKIASDYGVEEAYVLVKRIFLEKKADE
jgi:hypothetical protein